jgi:hypothetical protein
VSQFHSVHNKSHKVVLRSNLGFNSAKLMTICLNFDMGFYNINHTFLHWDYY